jgi:signal transduction histidine kinase
LQANLFSGPDNRSADLLIKFTDRTGEVHRELETWTFQNLLAHKFRTPLNGMGATLDLVLSDPGLLQSTQARKLLASARLSARRLEDSVIDVLRYHDALCAPESDATAADQDWEKLLHETASEAGLELLRINSRGAGSAPVPGYCVASLRLALVEVMENYRKFSEAPRLGLDASFLGPDRLRLFAPGPALPPEFVARLGRPYWQVEKNFSGEIPGMGLGLATARLLLRSQGADLTFSLHVDPAGLVSDFSLPLPPSL